MHVYLHQTWVDKPMFIEVNKMFMCSVNKGDWHGAAQYVNTREEGGEWTLLFNRSGDPYHMKQVAFTQLKNSNTFLNKNIDPEYSALLIEQPSCR